MTDLYIKAHFDETRQSQLPFVELLLNMGWEYLSLKDLEEAREHKNDRHILKNITYQALNKINAFEFGGKVHQFSPKNINNAIYDLESVQFQGLVSTSEEIYADLVGGRDLKEFINGRDESFNFQYFDFENIENNTFHVAVEVTSKGVEKIRPDIVLYVNGIPLVIIENKKSAVEIKEAINQLLDYQKKQKCPRLFLYPQLLIATNKNEFLYGTTNTPAKFFSVWKEENIDKEEIAQHIKKPIDKVVYQNILEDLNGATQGHKQLLDRSVSSQDIGVFYMLNKKMLMGLFKNFILYDGNIKKVARYQQIRAVNKTLDTISTFEEGKRKGGIIWHTQGSGKSLTMVLLARAIFSDKSIKDPRVIVVTDRKDLDRQIKKTFKNCKLKKEVVQAKSGSDLIEKLKTKKSQVITTLVYKFDSAFKSGKKFVDKDENIFVLVDEAHRSQGGDAHTNMGNTLPYACCIAFTGTPLMKGEKQTQKKFGNCIDKYTIDDAIGDGNVLPLVYERRENQIKQFKELVEKKIDNDKEILKLGDEEKRKLQKELTVRTILEIETVVAEIAEDIAKHFQKNAFLYNTETSNGFKGQIVTASKYSAILFQKYFQQFHAEIETSVIISEETIRHEEEAPKQKQEIKRYMENIAHAYGSMEQYEKNAIDSFNDSDEGVKLLIVVDKLLTGFDAPRNTFLYLIKPLKDHNLLQAIARVNRLCEQTKEPKTVGYVIDYSYNENHIKEALELFSNFSPEDVDGALIDVNAKIKELEEAYDNVLKIFENVENQADDEAYVNALENDDCRKMFYKNINKFVKVFAEAKALREFDETFGERNLNLYKNQLKKFLHIKKTAVNKYADSVDLSYYKEKIFKVLEVALETDGIRRMVKPMNILDMKSVDESTKGLSTKSAAETILSQAKREVLARMDQDPVFYKSFYEKIEELLQKIKQGEFFDEMLEDSLTIIRQAFGKKTTQGEVSAFLGEDEFAQIVYRNIGAYFEEFNLSDEEFACLVLGITQSLKRFLIVDWTRNSETQRIIRNKLDDYIYDNIVKAKDINVLQKSDEIIATIMNLALNNTEKLDVT